MTANYMVFSALLVVPVSAMICVDSFLYFFILFPVAAVSAGKWMYCRRLIVVSFPPAVLMIWAYLTGNDQSSLTSLRWICALASGTYFASELGTAGMAGVLDSMRLLPFSARLSELLTLAGSTASNVKSCWAAKSDLPLFSRIIQSAGDSVAKADSTLPAAEQCDVIPFSLSIVSWVFLLVSVSGIADGIAA